MSREIVEKVGWCSIVDASQSRPVIFVDDVDEERVSLGVRMEFIFTVIFRQSRPGGDRLRQSSIKTFNHAVGLRMKRPRQTVIDAVSGAQPVESMASGHFGFRRPACASKTVGKLGTVVGHDGVDLMRENRNEAIKTSCDCYGIALAGNLDVDEARGAIDGDKDEAGYAAQAREMLQINMYKADACRFKAGGGRLGGLRLSRDAMALKAAMNLASRQLGVHAAPQDFDDIIERQLNAGAKFDGQAFFKRRHRCGDAMRPVRAVGHVFARFPAGDSSRADAELFSQITHRCRTPLNVSACLGRGGRVRVQPHMHDLRCSVTYAIPFDTPILSRQSPGTKHEGGHPRQGSAGAPIQ